MSYSDGYPLHFGGLSTRQDMNADIPPNLREVVETIGAVLRPCAVDTVVAIGGGSEHWAFEVNGSLIARLRKQADEHMASAGDRRRGTAV